MVWNFCTRHTHHTTELLSNTRLNSFIKSEFGRKENIILSANVPFFVSFTRCKTGRYTYLFYKREYDIISWLYYTPMCAVYILFISYTSHLYYIYYVSDRGTRCCCNRYIILSSYTNVFVFNYLNVICICAPLPLHIPNPLIINVV